VFASSPTSTSISVVALLSSVIAVGPAIAISGSATATALKPEEPTNSAEIRLTL
jgi:hypothetical protein